jgi:hypothetical protein
VSCEWKGPDSRLRCSWKNNVEMYLKKIKCEGGCELYVCGPGQSLVEGPFEYSNEPSVATKSGDVRNQLFVY